MNAAAGRVPIVLLSLPTVMYATGCLANTEDMVAMAPEGIPMIRGLVLVLGVSLLAAGALIHTKKYAYAAGIGVAVLMVITAFGIHLPGFLRTYPAELGEAMIELQQRMSMSGVIKDMGLAGAGLMVAKMARDA